MAEEIEAAHPGVSLAVACDVGDDLSIGVLIDAAQATFGPIDLFFANAGIGLGTDLETSDADWDLAFDVNTKAHHYAARRLVPGWVARGDGYFCSTASAAGLLTQIGSAPYAVTKHAAVAFAEWLSITYGGHGVKVSCLCPMGVNTNMLNAGDLGTNTGADVVRAAGEVLEPEDVADVVRRRHPRRAVPDPAPPRGAHLLPAQDQRLRPLAERHAPAAGPSAPGVMTWQ